MVRAASSSTTRLVLGGGFLLALTFILVAAMAATTATAAGPHSSFRCYRPFSSLSAFKPSSMHGTDNCNLGFIAVKNATATATCDASGCSVQVKIEEGARVTMTKNDQARYKLELKAVNDSTISYKGFDGRGYSMCCMFMDKAECEWVESEEQPPLAEGEQQPAVTTIGTKKQVVTKCPLQDRVPESEAVSELSLSGSITKPLHSYRVGSWDATLSLFDFKEVEPVGRVKIFFELTQEEVDKFLLAKKTEGDSAADEATGTEAAVPSDSAAIVPQDGEPIGSAIVTVKKTEEEENKKEL